MRTGTDEKNAKLSAKGLLVIYTVIWLVALLILTISLFQSTGDARVVNYSGIVRGATQKLVKEEISAHPDDELIAKLDRIIENLRTGKGSYDLNRCDSKKYQNQLSELSEIWTEMKTQIAAVRSGEDPQTLYALSQAHFALADDLVLSAEKYADLKLWGSIGFLLIYLSVTIVAFFLFYQRHRFDLKKSGVTDRLTGISNRQGFEIKVTEILKANGDKRYLMLRFDLSDFKFINDAYGYECGDLVLKSIAKTLETRFHGGETCARIDADDFMVFASASETLISEVRQLTLDAVANLNKLNANEMVDLICGVYAAEPGVKVKTMIDSTSLAHKHAKNCGKSATLWYNDELIKKIQWQKTLLAHLPQGLKNNEFKLYFQPKCNVNDLSVVSAEALVRWEYPGYGLIGPDYFIPLFEENGTIFDLDLYMLDKACAHIAARIEKNQKVIPLSVNFSRVTLYRKEFYDVFIRTVQKYGIEPEYIEAEITEGAFHSINETMLSVLRRLRANGFSVSMDDFGAGYSSLNLLNTLPIDYIKLDREFLGDYTKKYGNVEEILKCIIGLAHALKLMVVCEGVENQAHVDLLRNIGCTLGQGYFFSEPIEENRFIETYY